MESKENCSFIRYDLIREAEKENRPKIIDKYMENGSLVTVYEPRHAANISIINYGGVRGLHYD